MNKTLLSMLLSALSTSFWWAASIWKFEFLFVAATLTSLGVAVWIAIETRNVLNKE